MVPAGYVELEASESDFRLVLDDATVEVVTHELTEGLEPPSDPGWGGCLENDRGSEFESILLLGKAGVFEDLDRLVLWGRLGALVGLECVDLRCEGILGCGESEGRSYADIGSRDDGPRCREQPGWSLGGGCLWQA